MADKVLTLSLDHCQSFSTGAQAELSHFLKSHQVPFLQAVVLTPIALPLLPKFVRWHWECIEPTLVKASNDRVKFRKSRLNQCPLAIQ